MTYEAVMDDMMAFWDFAAEAREELEAEEEMRGVQMQERRRRAEEQRRREEAAAAERMAAADGRSLVDRMREGAVRTLARWGWRARTG